MLSDCRGKTRLQISTCNLCLKPLFLLTVLSRSNILGCFAHNAVVTLKWKAASFSVCDPCTCFHPNVILTSCGGGVLFWRSCWISLSFSAWLERSFCNWTSNAETRESLSFLHFSMVCSFSASWDDKESWERGTCKCKKMRWQTAGKL